MKKIAFVSFIGFILLAFVFSSTSCTTNNPTPVHDTVYVHVHDTTNTHDTVGCTNGCSGAVACYSFDGNINDGSGNNFNGTNHGGTLVPGRKGTPNSAYHFDSATQYIDLPIFNAITSNSNEFSISFWSKADNKQAANTVFALWPDNPSDRLLFHTNYSHNGCSCIITVLDCGDINGSGRHTLFNQVFSTSWEHYVCIVSQVLNKVIVYKNNTVIINEAGFVNVNRNKTLRLAAPFLGTIDDLKIFNKVLSASEVNQLYNE